MCIFCLKPASFFLTQEMDSYVLHVKWFKNCQILCCKTTTTAIKCTFYKRSHVSVNKNYVFIPISDTYPLDQINLRSPTCCPSLSKLEIKTLHRPLFTLPAILFFFYYLKCTHATWRVMTSAKAIASTSTIKNYRYSNLRHHIRN